MYIEKRGWVNVYILMTIYIANILKNLCEKK